MPTNTAGNQATMYHTAQVHYLVKRVNYTDDGTAITIGTIPGGATILKPISGVSVNVAFNAGSSNVIDIGTTDNDDLYMTDGALGSIAFVPLDEAVTMSITSPTTITATVALGGTAATAGVADVVIAYVLRNWGG